MCANIRMSEPPESICKVCEAPNATNHYGSKCCSGCKGFFRRSIRYRRIYNCPRSKNCPINKRYRNVCRACRLQKCLSAGLNPQLVQSEWGHHPSTAAADPAQHLEYSETSPESEIATKNAQSSSHDSSMALTMSKMLMHRALGQGTAITTIPDLTYSNTNNPLANVDFLSICTFLVQIERICDLFVDQPENCTISPLNYAAYTFNLELPVQLAYKQPGLICERFPMGWSSGQLTHTSSFARCYSRLLVHYFDWVSHLPEFMELSESNRITLVVRRATRCMYLLLCFQAAHRNTDGIPMSCDRYYPLDPVEQQKLQPEIREMFSETIEMAIQELVRPMRELNISETEYAILRAICFFTPVPKLTKEGHRKVSSSREKYLSVFSQLVANKSNEQNSNTENSILVANFIPKNVRRMNRLLLLLTRIEQIAQMDDNSYAMLTAFNIAQMRGNLTFELHVRGE